MGNLSQLLLGGEGRLSKRKDGDVREWFGQREQQIRSFQGERMGDTFEKQTKSWVWLEHKFWEMVAIKQKWGEDVDQGLTKEFGLFLRQVDAIEGS